MQTHSLSTISTNTVLFRARLPLPERQPAAESIQAVAGGQHSQSGAQLPWGPAWMSELACPAADPPPLPLPGTETPVGSGHR